MGSACLQNGFRPAPLGQMLQQAQLRDSLPRSRRQLGFVLSAPFQLSSIDGHALAVIGVAAYRSINHCMFERHPSPEQRMIFANGGPFA